MGRQQGSADLVEEHEVYDELLKILDNPAAHQEKILARILSRNAKAEYLLKHRMDGATDVRTFREKVPVSDFDDYKPFVDRILEGEKSPLLAGDPVTEFWISSGTSMGALKLCPITDEDMVHRAHVRKYSTSILNRFMPNVAKSKRLALFIVRPTHYVAGGLPCRPGTTAILENPIFAQGRGEAQLTTPLEVITNADDMTGIYCHLLLGLLQRDEVGRISSEFPAVLIKAMRCLEEWWVELCDDIANGTLSTSRVKHETVRAAVLSRSRKDSDLAELLKKEFRSACESASWDGIIPKLWPNVEVVDVSCTGSFEPYFKIVSKYAGNVPIIFTGFYVSTEGYHGLNLDPSCPSNKVRYTLFPESAYYEFIPVPDENDTSQANKKDESGPGEVVDLVSVREGQVYEILVTTLSGLYRYRMGDVLKVVGHFKSNPTFQLLGRASASLSIDTDKTEEKDLHVAFMQGSQLLELELGLRIRDYTSTVDFSSKPPHYVIFWEIHPNSSNSTAAKSTISSNQSESIVAKCCAAMEAALSQVYRRGRFENLIGPLEVRLVREGTFDLLCEVAMSRGTSFAQFKTPRIMTPSRPGLNVVASRVIQSVFSQEKPPYNPANTKSSTGEPAVH